jgi:hypothetical protein
LDLVPGAAAAYSLRSLSNSYAGPVVTVRRSSDDAEEDFTSGEVADGTLAAFCGAGDGFVKQWWDQSGNTGRDVSQTTSAYQPQIVDAGAVITEEGKPAILFDGSNDYLSNSLTIWGRGGVGFFDFYAVVKCATEGSGVGTVAAARKTTSLFDGWQVRNNSGTNGLFFAVDFNGTDGDSVVGATDKRDSQVLLYAALNNTPTMYVDGAYDVSSAADGLSVAYTPTVKTMNVGATGTTASSADHIKGTMQELLLYFVDTSSQRELIEGNIAWSYS